MAVSHCLLDDKSGVLISASTEGLLALTNVRYLIQNYQHRFNNHVVQPGMILDLPDDVPEALHREERRFLLIFGQNTVYVLNLPELIDSVKSVMGKKRFKITDEKFFRAQEKIDFSLAEHFVAKDGKLFFSKGDNSIYRLMTSEDASVHTKLIRSMKSQILSIALEKDTLFVLHSPHFLSSLRLSDMTLTTSDLSPEIGRIFNGSSPEAPRLFCSPSQYLVYLARGKTLASYDLQFKKCSLIAEASCEIDSMVELRKNELMISTSSAQLHRISSHQLSASIDSNNVVNYWLGCPEEQDEGWMFCWGSGGFVEFYFMGVRMLTLAAFHS